MKRGFIFHRKALYGFLVVSLALLLSACKSGVAALDSSPYEGTALQGPATDFRLRDQTGRVISLSDFSGRLVLLTFLDTRCDDVCPLTAIQLRKAYQMLGKEAESVAFLGINVNVEANSVADVRSATEKWRLDEIQDWHFLTGNAAELEPVWEAYNVAVVPEVEEEIMHSPGIFLIDQTGQLRWYISTPFDETGNADGTAPLSELLVKRLRELMKEG